MCTWVVDGGPLEVFCNLRAFQRKSSSSPVVYDSAIVAACLGAGARAVVLEMCVRSKKLETSNFFVLAR